MYSIVSYNLIYPTEIKNPNGFYGFSIIKMLYKWYIFYKYYFSSNPLEIRWKYVILWNDYQWKWYKPPKRRKISYIVFTWKEKYLGKYSPKKCARSKKNQLPFFKFLFVIFFQLRSSFSKAFGRNKSSGNLSEENGISASKLNSTTNGVHSELKLQSKVHFAYDKKLFLHFQKMRKNHYCTQKRSK